MPITNLNLTGTSFMTAEELKNVGFGSYGKNVLISKKASFYSSGTIHMGDNVRIDDFCLLSGKIMFGSFVHISAYASIFGTGGVELGDYTNLSIRSTILSASDDISGEFFANSAIPDEFRNVTYAKVVLEKFSWVGTHALILPGVKISCGSAIGALSLVKEDTLPWSIYVGVPAKKIKERSENMIELENKLKTFLLDARSL